MTPTTTTTASTAAVRLPDPEPCPSWCTDPEHREPGWAEQDLRRVDGQVRDASRFCTQVIGTATWVAVPDAEVDSTRKAAVLIERFQSAEPNAEVEVNQIGVIVRGSANLADFDHSLTTKSMPPETALHLSRLLAVAAERAGVTR